MIDLLLLINNGEKEYIKNMPVLHLVIIVFVVLAFVGLCWYLLNSFVPMDARIKVVLNFILVVGLILFLLVWVLPKVLTLVSILLI
jgi:hypothetical protein